MRDEFLSEEDLDLKNLTPEELYAWWDLWLELAQATNDVDAHMYSHGVFAEEPGRRSMQTPPPAAAGPQTGPPRAD